MEKHLSIILITSLIVMINAAPILNYPRVITYLTEFGYLSKTHQETGRMPSEDEVEMAIKNLQNMAGLPKSGNDKNGSAVENIMKLPRCGVGDNRVGKKPNSFPNFDLSGSKWNKRNITFHIQNYYSDADEDFVRSELLRALNMWKNATNLEFKESDAEADIVISFHRKEHGDGYPFDGPGGSLAHAFPPGPDRGGDVHFDDEEVWVKNITEDCIELYRFAAHEFGHSLGILHSNLNESIMYPWYSTHNQGLSSGDVEAMRNLYGSKRNQSKQIPPTDDTTHPPLQDSSKHVGRTSPDPCNTDIDALARVKDETFIFKGPWFWRFDVHSNFISRPIRFHYFWNDLPMKIDRIDAMTYHPKLEQALIFSGDTYWKFVKRFLIESPSHGHPLTTLGLSKDIKKIDAALTWGPSNRIYLFSDYVYWRLDNSTEMISSALKVEAGYPKSVDVWKNIPVPIDSAFTDFDGSAYFFSGLKVYKFDIENMTVDPTYPRHIRTKWPGCRFKFEALLDSTRTKGIFLLMYSCLVAAVVMTSLMSDAN